MSKPIPSSSQADTYDALTCAADALSFFHSIFLAINKEFDKSDNPLILGLSKTGQYLSEEFHSHFEYLATQIEKEQEVKQ